MPKWFELVFAVKVITEDSCFVLDGSRSCNSIGTVTGGYGNGFADWDGNRNKS